MANEEKKSAYAQVKTWLENSAMLEILQRTLPSGTPVGAWVSAALNTVRTTKDIAKCEPLSTMGALMTIASMGLRLEGPLGQAYLQARAVREKSAKTGQWETARMECQAGIGYRGLIALARRDPNVRDVEATIVHQADDFAFERGSKTWLSHRWDVRLSAEARGPMVAVYAGLRYRDGYYSFDVFPMVDVIAQRDRVLQQSYITVERADGGGERFWKSTREGKLIPVNPKDQGVLPWVGHPIPMIQKTAVRWAAKYWNLAPELDRATQLVAMDEAGTSQGLAQAALGVMPDHIRHAAEQSSGLAFDPSQQAQVATYRTSSDLKAHMLEQATGRRASDGQPQPSVSAPEDEDQRPKVEPEDESQGDPPPMTDEEKEEALRLERELAAKEAEERQASLLDLK